MIFAGVPSASGFGSSVNRDSYQFCLGSNITSKSVSWIHLQRNWTNDAFTYTGKHTTFGYTRSLAADANDKVGATVNILCGNLVPVRQTDVTQLIPPIERGDPSDELGFAVSITHIGPVGTIKGASSVLFTDTPPISITKTLE